MKMPKKTPYILPVMSNKDRCVLTSPSLYKNSIFDTILDNRYQILITQSSYICVLIGN